MSRPMIRINTGEEIIDREMNDAEFEQYQAERAAEAVKQQELAEAAAKRQALLDKLGITEDEAKLLLGGN
jgi:hypothetical protein